MIVAARLVGAIRVRAASRRWFRAGDGRQQVPRQPLVVRAHGREALNRKPIPRPTPCIHSRTLVATLTSFPSTSQTHIPEDARGSAARNVLALCPCRCVCYVQCPLPCVPANVLACVPAPLSERASGVCVRACCESRLVVKVRCGMWRDGAGQIQCHPS